MKLGIVANTTKPALSQTLNDLLLYLKKKKLQVVFPKSLFEWGKKRFDKKLLANIEGLNDKDFVRQSDIVISFGGDGTMLAAARLVGKSGKPLLGVNLGKLGFLAEVSIDETHTCIDEIIKGNYLIEERMILEATCITDGTKFYALNEIVVDKGASPRVIELETYVNGDYMVTYSADGIILNTPTGSTAYSLASGGPIVHPMSNVITINPVAPHTLSARPVIVPDTSIIKVNVKADGKDAHITADGQVEKFFPTPSEFIIRRAEYTIKLIKRKKRTYYDLLRTKLQWGKDIRTTRS